jgi:hypothetical protein
MFADQMGQQIKPGISRMLQNIIIIYSLLLEPQNQNQTNYEPAY